MIRRLSNSIIKRLQKYNDDILDEYISNLEAENVDEYWETFYFWEYEDFSEELLEDEDLEIWGEGEDLTGMTKWYDENALWLSLDEKLLAHMNFDVEEEGLVAEADQIADTLDIFCGRHPKYDEFRDFEEEEAINYLHPLYRGDYDDVVEPDEYDLNDPHTQHVFYGVCYIPGSETPFDEYGKLDWDTRFGEYPVDEFFPQDGSWGYRPMTARYENYVSAEPWWLGPLS